jgi:hypothetical protein
MILSQDPQAIIKKIRRRSRTNEPEFENQVKLSKQKDLARQTRDITLSMKN